MTKVFQLASGDWIKGLFMAVIVPVVLKVYTVIQGGSFTVDWHMLALVAASAFLGYIIKNLGTSSTVATLPAGVPIPATSTTPAAVTTAPTVVVTEKTFGVTTRSTAPVLPVTPTK